MGIFSSEQIKPIVEDMRNLLSQTHIAFLIGAGCSKCAGLPLMSELTSSVINSDKLSEKTRDLLTKICDCYSGGEDSTIEDYMSEVVDLLSIARRRNERSASQTGLTIGSLSTEERDLEVSISEIKDAIRDSICQSAKIENHQRFIRSIHKYMQAGKDCRKVDYYILNYDTLIEDALGVEKVQFVDGFSGSATGWWNSDLYNNNKIDVRVFKVHGSIDWCLVNGDALPRRIRPGIITETKENHVLIYPAATKYQETQRDPFAQIMHFMRTDLCPGNGKEIILGICGYSFGDHHIDMEIESALFNSQGRLTVAAFVSTDEPQGKLIEWLNNPTISEQVRVYSSKGYYHGVKKEIFKENIDWWKFETLADLLGGKL